MNTLDPYISQSIKNMESIKERKIIQSEISDMIGVMEFFSAGSENSYFATMGENPLKWGMARFMPRARLQESPFWYLN